MKARPLLLLFFTINAFCYCFGQDINAGRIAHDSFNGNANDQVGNAHGALFGPQLVKDRFDNNANAYQFDGINDYIEIPHDPKFNFTADDDFSISFWVKINGTQSNLNGTSNEIMGKWIAVNNQGYPFALRYWNQTASQDDKNKLFFVKYDSESCGNGPRNQSPCALQTNEWYHVVYIRRGTSLILYQNGGAVDEITDNTQISCNTINSEPIYIGKRQANQRHFTGIIDDISFYNRALTNAEVNILTNEGGWSSPSNPDNETELISFDIQEQISEPSINEVEKTIDVKIACNEDITNLIAEFEISNMATVTVNETEQISAVTTNDFSSSLTYTITSANECAAAEWLVSVSKNQLSQSEINSLTAFESFRVPDQIGLTTIDNTTNTITLDVACDNDVTNLSVSFTLADGAIATLEGNDLTSGQSSLNFSEPIELRVENFNGCLAESLWTVAINRIRPSELPFVPNFISPNGDPHNQSWVIEDISQAKLSVKIYNRWGGLVYANNNYK